jgi:very-short-patch-repair endonuclease
MTGIFKPRNTARARELRREATPAERLLWTALSNRKVAGHKFSRQMPVGSYFADFLCREAKLVIELDGYSHDMRQEYDGRRDAFMAGQGLTVLRFANDDVLNNLDGVLTLISETVRKAATPHPNPSPEGEGLKEQIPLEGSVG